MPPVPPPTRPALRERYDRRQKRIIAAAAKLFAKQGFAATSISDLSDATGLAAGGLYHYIGNKDKLLITVCEDLLQPLLEQSRPVLENDSAPAQQLREFMHVWLAHVASHRFHMIVFSQERRALEKGPGWSRIRKQREEFEGLLDEILARGERDGSLAFEDRQLTLLSLLGMVNYTPQWLNPRGRLSPEQIADRYCDFVLLSAQPPR